MRESELIGDQRAANACMVQLTIRAQELTEQAQAALARAESATNALRESEERYRTLFELSPVAVYSCEASGVIQKFNRHAAELWGRTPSLGDTDERFCGSFKLFRSDGTFMPHDLCPMADVLSSRVPEVHDVEVWVERPDGSRIVVLVNVRPVKNARGEVTAAVNCFFDITARKDAEDRLIESLKRERALAEFRERFIGILGHDLRTPLNAMIMATGLLVGRGNLTEEDSRLASRITQAGQRMARMIGQLAEFTRARLGGGFELSLARSDLGSVCRDMAEELRIGSSVEIRQTTEGDLHGYWDSDRLAEAISNIAGNAVDHATPGTAVDIHARAAGESVVVEITNHGKCIPAPQLPVIFKAFRRASVSAANTGHLGLGLYIAHEVVTSHGGTLDVRSSDGATTFTLRLLRETTPIPPSVRLANDADESVSPQA